MKKIKKYRFILVVFLAGLFVMGVYLTKDETIYGSASDNVTGWAWGGGDNSAPVGNPEAGSGWISFNCYNYYNLAVDNTLEDRCSPEPTYYDYGVHVDSSTGGFSGEAWVGGGEEGGVDVPMLGWLSFDRSETGNPPAAPFNTGDPTDSIASLDFQTGQVLGWMRALAADGNGWDGWIKLGDSSGNWYGTDQKQVTVDLVTKKFKGWAWGGRDINGEAGVVGWISFNCEDQGTCAGDGGYDYWVGADINFPPKGSELNPQSTFDCCEDSLHPKLSWTYSDPDNIPLGTDPQTAYHIQIDVEGSNDFESPFKLEKIAYTDSTTYAVKEADMVDDDLEWNTTYYWRVKVKDSDEHWSDWSSVVSFTTLPHACPDVHFSYAPDQPSAEENVSFRDSSICYEIAYLEGRECTDPPDSYAWDFTLIEGSGGVYYDGAPVVGPIYVENPIVSFSEPSKWEMTLTVTDGTPQAYSCTSDPPKTINVREPLPWWREIIPR